MPTVTRLCIVALAVALVPLMSAAAPPKKAPAGLKVQLGELLPAGDALLSWKFRAEYDNVVLYSEPSPGVIRVTLVQLDMGCNAGDVCNDEIVREVLLQPVFWYAKGAIVELSVTEAKVSLAKRFWVNGYDDDPYTNKIVMKLLGKIAIHGGIPSD